jgi:hypothetical protein
LIFIVAHQLQVGSSPIDMTPPDGMILIRSAPVALQRAHRAARRASGTVDQVVAHRGMLELGVEAVACVPVAARWGRAALPPPTSAGRDHAVGDGALQGDDHAVSAPTSRTEVKPAISVSRGKARASIASS